MEIKEVNNIKDNRDIIGAVPVLSVKDIKTLTSGKRTLIPSKFKNVYSLKEYNLLMKEAENFYKLNKLNFFDVMEKACELSKNISKNTAFLLSKNYKIDFTTMIRSQNGIEFPKNIKLVSSNSLFQNTNWLSLYLKRINKKGKNYDYFLKALKKEEGNKDNLYFFRIPGTDDYMRGSLSILNEFQKNYPHIELNISKITAQPKTNNLKNIRVLELPSKPKNGGN